MLNPHPQNGVQNRERAYMVYLYNNNNTLYFTRYILVMGLSGGGSMMI